MPWFPVLLATHIALAVSLLVPSLLLPFLLPSGDAGSSRQPGSLAGFLLRMQGTGSVLIGIGLAITGAGLLVVLGPDLLRKPWLLAALSIYALNLLVAGFVSRPNLRRLIGMEAIQSPADGETWRRRARRQRLLAYAMALATGVIGFLMSTKPEF